MPPLHTYIFENTKNIGLYVTIKAYNYHEAIIKLTEIVFNPKDFQTKP